MNETMTVIRPGQVLPDIALPAAGGAVTRLSSYRGRRNLVLVFAGDAGCEGCRDLLRALAGAYAEVQQEHAEVVAVLRGPLRQADEVARAERLPYPVLADEDGLAHAAYGLPEATTDGAVFISDRYGEVFAVYDLSKTPHPSADAILDWLRFIQVQCPE